MTGLAGKRVLITRPAGQAAPLARKLAELGAVPLVFSTIEIVPADPAPLDEALARLSSYAWVIFTSVNGVEAVWQRLAALNLAAAAFAGVKTAAIGPATAQALAERGVRPQLVPDEFVAEAILAGLGDVRGQRILLPRAEIARKVLVEELQKRGAFPEEITAYRTLPAQPDPAVLREVQKGVDIATFTSSSTVNHFFELLGAQAGPLLQGALIACIGPITAETARAQGLAVAVVAKDYTTDGLVEALRQYTAKPSQGLL